MSEHYFKYKALSLTPEGLLDNRSLKHVIGPIVDSYYYLPTREKLNDPNEGIFQNQIQKEISTFLQGITGTREKKVLTVPLNNLIRQVNQSTDNSGVFSLSMSVTDELMWAHYGSSHCGIAIEYNLDQLTRFSSSQHLHSFAVKYVDEPPNLDMRNLLSDAGESVRTMLGHKSPRWMYEEEYRVVLENINGKIPHDYRAVKSITFGLKVPGKVREKIYETTKHKVSKYYEICKMPGSYSLNRELLEAYSGNYPTGTPSGIDWRNHFEGLKDTEKAKVINMVEREIDNDPHFKELLLADKSSIDPSKAVLSYDSQHLLGLEAYTNNTKIYYEL